VSHTVIKNGRWTDVTDVICLTGTFDRVDREKVFGDSSFIIHSTTKILFSSCEKRCKNNIQHAEASLGPTRTGTVLLV
jgi:hypothetical protein